MVGIVYSINTEQRAKANNKFEKSIFKLMNNALVGKAMENVRVVNDNCYIVSYDVTPP